MINKLREVVKVNGEHRWSSSFDKLITFSILIAIIHLTLETEKAIYEAYTVVFEITEIILTVIFTFEYIARILTYNKNYYGKSFL